VYKVAVLYDVLGGAEENPIFQFESLNDVVNFMEICFKNGYDVLIKHDEFK
jgi:hypothetical protein